MGVLAGCAARGAACDGQAAGMSDWAVAFIAAVGLVVALIGWRVTGFNAFAYLWGLIT